jgi:DNA replication protein DnaC
MRLNSTASQPAYDRPAGAGKSWLSCALGHKACREDFSVAYHRLPRLFATLALARGDGNYPKVLKALARTDLLILGDWGPEKLNDEQRRDLLEIVEDRYEKRSTIVTSQVPVEHWYDMIDKPIAPGNVTRVRTCAAMPRSRPSCWAVEAFQLTRARPLVHEVGRAHL